jgi:hypothetical protein
MGETLSLRCPYFKWFLDCSILLNAAPNLGLRRGQNSYTPSSLTARIGFRLRDLDNWNNTCTIVLRKDF